MPSAALPLSHQQPPVRPRLFCRIRADYGRTDFSLFERKSTVAKTWTTNRNLAPVTKLALALPEAQRKIHGSHAQFLVRKKTFAYFLDNHHGDGIVAINCKVLPGENAALVNAQPRRYYMPDYLASRGWVGLRLDVGKVDWDEVRELLLGSYLLAAPKRLAALVTPEA